MIYKLIFNLCKEPNNFQFDGESKNQSCPLSYSFCIFFGWEMALGNLIVGCIWCITIVGIPFGKQFFKMARLSFMPFGASVIG